MRTEWIPSAILHIPAINEMIDVTTKRRVELYSHVPLMIILLFAGVALAYALPIGQTMAGPRPRNVLQGASTPRRSPPTLFVVLDLEFPRAGLVRLNLAESALEHLRDTMR